MTDVRPPPAPPRLRVLLVDDDIFTLDLLAAMIGALGDFDIGTESDASRALHALAAQPPALLVCDLSMPDMDGIEFLGAAAAAGFQGQVMLLSGMAGAVRHSAERLAQAQGLAVIGAFQKPISSAELQGALARLIASAAPQHRNLYNVTTLSEK